MKTTSILTEPHAAASGVFKIGGDLPVHRLGFGAMRLTGQGVWGEPKDPAEARRVLRKAVELGVRLDRHRRFLWSRSERTPHRGGAPSLSSGIGHRHQRRPDAGRSGEMGARRAAGVSPAMRRDEFAPAENRPPRSLPTPSHRSAGARRGVARGPPRTAAGGKDPPYRLVRSLRRGDQAGQKDRENRECAEPLQSRRPPERSRPRLLCRGRARLHPLVSARGWGDGPTRRTSPIRSPGATTPAFPSSPWLGCCTARP